MRVDLHADVYHIKEDAYGILSAVAWACLLIASKMGPSRLVQKLGRSLYLDALSWRR